MVFKNRKLIFKLDEKRDAIMDIHVEFSFWGYLKMLTTPKSKKCYPFLIFVREFAKFGVIVDVLPNTFVALGGKLSDGQIKNGRTERSGGIAITE
ncbi:hypothetical protein EXW38_29950 (plasmid) [Bacillus mycoides]|nr:hypothetical protein EXW38_29950 [Bacillus mycoides]